MKIYIIGIEGAGTSALAQMYTAAGHDVSGSDDGDGFYRAQLRDIGVRVFPDFDASHVPADVDMVVYSTAFGGDNPEIVAARVRGVKTLSYPEAVAELFNAAAIPIAVCGTHGKTTTTALLAEVLRACDRDPRAIVGSQIVGWRGNALTGAGDAFVLEADEYQNKLRHYAPRAVILTSVDYDHPDYFATPAAYKQAFADFVARIPRDGVVVACGDSDTVRDVMRGARCRVITYGTSARNDVRVEDGDVGDGTHHFRVNGTAYEMALPGAHNALNAAAAITLAWELGCDIACVARGVAAFRGARRRFETHGTHNGALLVDDYAHHPVEIRATLAAARAAAPDRRLIAAFHPHTFTRTKALLDDFAQALAAADVVLVLDIYGSAREAHGGVSAQDLVDRINQIDPDRARRIPTIDDLAAWARTHLRDTDFFLTLGAGDIWKVMEKVKEV